MVYMVWILFLHNNFNLVTMKKITSYELYLSVILAKTLENKFSKLHYYDFKSPSQKKLKFLRSAYSDMI